jgi:hypothetical protein
LMGGGERGGRTAAKLGRIRSAAPEGGLRLRV